MKILTEKILEKTRQQEEESIKRKDKRKKYFDIKEKIVQIQTWKSNGKKGCGEGVSESRRVIMYIRYLYAKRR